MAATGRLVHHDPASRGYAAAPVTATPRSWMHIMGPVLDQGRINGCTGWSGADWCNSAVAQANRARYNAYVHGLTSLLGAQRYLGNPDGLSLYEAATQKDNLGWTYPPTDQGSTGLGVAKALKALGVIDQYLWTFDFATMLGWAQRQPVLLGTLWTDAMMDPNLAGLIDIGTDAQIKAADDAGEGHEYTLVGVYWSAKLARIRNHWTPQWGLHGDALIRLDQLERLVIDYRGDVCVPEVVAR